jgi:Sec-independent protein translocase protein TatA
MPFFNNQQDDDPDRNQIARSGLMTLVAAYIIYLGVQILKGYIDGEKGLPAWAALLFGILFIVLGAGYLVFLLRNVIILSKKTREAAESSSDGQETDEEAKNAETQETPETEESSETPETEASETAKSSESPEAEAP